ncbi:MAG: DUF2938 domain-containing protein [Desulfobacteraceae bacterium]|nr:DUF2938 domain-containing protein [Desulfobacteraceae bacterium]
MKIDILILESVLMGVFATLIMDFFASVLAKRKIIHPFITPDAIGRWFLYMLKGKFTHDDISKTPPLKNEKLWCLISHYLIGVGLAGVYLLIESAVSTIRNQYWIPLAYGMVTVFLPWFWLLPSTGYGFIASKASNRLAVLRTNLLNHTNFGLGLMIWIILFHRYFL